jgi:hypothetical protein
VTKSKHMLQKYIFQFTDVYYYQKKCVYFKQTNKYIKLNWRLLIASDDGTIREKWIWKSAKENGRVSYCPGIFLEKWRRSPKWRPRLEPETGDSVNSVTKRFCTRSLQGKFDHVFQGHKDEWRQSSMHPYSHHWMAVSCQFQASATLSTAVIG